MKERILLWQDPEEAHEAEDSEAAQEEAASEAHEAEDLAEVCTVADLAEEVSASVPVCRFSEAGITARITAEAVVSAVLWESYCYR